MLDPTRLSSHYGLGGAGAYLPPKRCIPVMVAMNMKRASKPRKVSTLSRVCAINESCLRIIGSESIRVKTRRSRNIRRTLKEDSPLAASTMLAVTTMKSQTLCKFSRNLRMRASSLEHESDGLVWLLP